ncbi:FecR family protein [Chitinophaga barathri]|uniref:FecR family protein n=1 Tax=Chitinophaga barathri TaxID=1647451 RepID=A0A3N4MDG0_9BACT|nr:FecR family protein [Chitinophaga barathri]RPD39617.1 FecR family protein [Chitinophaga barathri]
MDQQRIKELAGKFLAGTATEAEQQELHAWYDSAATAGELPGEEETVRRRMLAQVRRRTQPASQVWRMAAAAAVFAAIAAAALFLLRQPHADAPSVSSGYGADALPGGDKATLTLADGTVIALDTAKNGTLAAQGGAQIAKSAGMQLVYIEDGAREDGPPVYNTITTPKGGQYQVQLPDGSRVWLNAASSLRFPASFHGGNRRVELHGEAYFDIKGDAAHPFIVTIPDMEVTVLGTEFNVSAYERGKQKTVLIKGAVKVQAPHNTAVLRPGQSAELQGGSRLQVADDPYAEDAAAWKDGMFIFTNEPLDEIMAQLSRWYNIESDYEKESLKGKIFTGQISRGEKLSEVLKMLEMTGTIHFRIENGTVTAMP